MPALEAIFEVISVPIYGEFTTLLQVSSRMGRIYPSRIASPEFKKSHKVKVSGIKTLAALLAINKT